MITRLSAGIIGLLAFLGMLLAGILAGNPFGTVISRALLGLVCGLFVGLIAGHIAQLIVVENVKSMVEKDIDAELAEKAGSVVAEKGKESSVTNKEAAQNNRDSRKQTFAARAARQVFERS